MPVKYRLMSFSSEEIARIHVEINSGDIPDFSEKMRDAAKSVSRLQEEIQQTQKDLGILAARGDQNSDNFKTMQGHLSKLQTQLKKTNKEMKFYTESMDINLMSSNQLNARSKVLANTLNALSKEAEPDRWNELNDELISCELLSNFVSLTDCKQPAAHAGACPQGCELLSNFVSLTDCKQLTLIEGALSLRCELLSNFVSLTDCKQRGNSSLDEWGCCELLSNFVSLTDCKQQGA